MNSFYLSVDLNLPQKLEVVNLKHKLGYSGLGLYFEILLKLAQQTDYVLTCDYDLLAYEFRVESKFVEQLIEDFNLFEIGNGVFFSEIVCEKMEELEKKKEQKAKAGIASGMARRRAKKKTEQRLNSVRTEPEQVDEQKRTIDKIDKIDISKKVLETFNQAFQKNQKSMAWQKNLEYWLGTYELEEILKVIPRLNHPDWWATKKNIQPNLEMLFRKSNSKNEGCDYIQQLLELGDVEVKEDKEDLYRITPDEEAELRADNTQESFDRVKKVTFEKLTIMEKAQNVPPGTFTDKLKNINFNKNR